MRNAIEGRYINENIKYRDWIDKVVFQRLVQIVTRRIKSCGKKTLILVKLEYRLCYHDAMLESA